MFASHKKDAFETEAEKIVQRTEQKPKEKHVDYELDTKLNQTVNLDLCREEVPTSTTSRRRNIFTRRSNNMTQALI